MRTSTLLVMALTVLLGCSGANEAPSTPADAVRAMPAPSGAPEPGRVAPPVRTCESHVVGDISGWRRTATIVGPVAFAGLPTYDETAPHRFFRARGDRFPTLKSLLIVERGPAVTVRILQPARARLLYDPAGWTSQRTYRLEQGEPAMVFEPCDFLRSTQFNGSWLVTGRTCVTVEVVAEGRGTERAEVPLGLEGCDRGSGSD
jgi:hypothetical protein